MTDPALPAGMPSAWEANRPYSQHRPPIVTVVRTPAELAALRSGRLRVRRGALHLELPGLDDDQARRIADRLASLRNECGCSMGAAFAYPTAAAVIVWLVVSPPAWTDHLVARIGVWMGTVIVAGTVGKALGIARARGAMRREIDALEYDLRQTAAGPAPNLHRGDRQDHAFTHPGDPHTAA